MVTVGTDTTNVGYTGHRWQPESALSLTQYRAYDPALGTWISEDPSGFSDGINLFTFVRNNPTRYRDPSGLWAAAVGGGYSAGAAIGPFGAHVEATCQLAVDGKGGVGLYCCAAHGPAFGLGGGDLVPKQRAFCYGCKTICDLPGRCGFVQLVVAGGAGGSVGGGISKGSGGTSVTGSVGGKGGYRWLPYRRNSLRLYFDPLQQELWSLQLTRYLSLALQLGTAAAALWICFVALLLLITLPQTDANLIQKTLMAVVALSFAATVVCWSLSFELVTWFG